MDLTAHLHRIAPKLPSLPECDRAIVAPLIEHMHAGVVRTVTDKERSTIIRLSVMEYSCPREQFLRDVSDLRMTVLRDDGADRHIQFEKPGTSCYHFDLLTWPGHLLITGDCGSFLFRRLHDMFEFFRGGQQQDPDGIGINPQYWSEKLLATDCGGSHGGAAKEYSKEKFEASIKRWFDERFEEEIREDADPDEEWPGYDAKGIAERKVRRDEIWSEIQSSVLQCSDSEHEALEAAMDFEHHGFRFVDFYEVDNRDYTFHFIWCAYAIAWGMKQYDAAKAPVAPAEVAA
jgi:hypothetical protein